MIRNLLILYPISVLHALFRSSDTDLGVPQYTWEFPKPFIIAQNTSQNTIETAADVFFTSAAGLWKRNSDELCDIAQNDNDIRAGHIAVAVKICMGDSRLRDAHRRILCGEARKAAEGYASFETENGVHLINLPSLACGNHHGDDRSMGIGVVIEAYEHSVAIRPRNFARHTMNRRVLIRDGKPYFEIELR